LAELREAAGDRLGFRPCGFEHRLVLVHAQHLERDPGAERIARKRVAVEKRALGIAQEPLEDPF
jgi:hypothetical protein